MRRATWLLGGLLLLLACQGEEEQAAEEGRAAMDSMVERSRSRPVQLEYQDVRIDEAELRRRRDSVRAASDSAPSR